MERPFRFGIVVRTASSGRAWADRARLLEDAGFDVLLVPDHLVGARFAPMTALTAAACATSRLKVGTMVFANDFRHPAVLAKEAATLDLLSDGRLEFGLGTGWMARDYDRAGLALDPPGVRLARLAEAIDVLNGLWRGGEFSYAGEYYTIDGLAQEPARRPRLLLGGGGPRMLRLAGREADIVNLTMRVHADGSGPDTSDAGPAAFRRKVDILRESPRFGEIELGTSVLRVGTGTLGAWSAADPVAQEGTPQILAGDLSQIRDSLYRWRDELGLSYYVLHNETDLDAFLPVVAGMSGR